MDIEITSKRYNNLTKDERDALYSLKDDPSIIIKGADKGSVVVVWDREDYLKEAYKQLYDREVYEEVPNDPNVPNVSNQHYNESFRENTFACWFV